MWTWWTRTENPRSARRGLAPAFSFAQGCWAGALVMMCGVGALPCASAQTDSGPFDIAPLREHAIAFDFDSGPVARAGSIEDEGVVASTVVSFSSAAWIRLDLSGTVLAGDAGADGASLRLTSLGDGGVQILNAEHLGFWHHATAAFNGESVMVELLSRGGIGASRLVVAGMTVGEPGSGFGVRTICETVDDRVLSTDARVGRTSGGCTAWMFDDANRMMASAGHCGVSATSFVGFNVPLSTSTGSYVQPSPSNQYVVDISSDQLANVTIGNDWHYFGVQVNSTTGLTPRQAQGQHFTLLAAPAVSGGAQARITGYGTTSAPVLSSWNGAQKTHLGPYSSITTSGSTVALRYHTDTTGGNSGSPIILESTGASIGIHTNGGCGTSVTSTNSGTASQNPGFAGARNAPLGVCRTGAFPALGDIYAIGDAANNFGRVDPASGIFGKVATVGAKWQGLAYNPAADIFYAVDSNRRLFTLNPDTGTIAADLGVVSGTTLTLTALAYDPATTRLYGVTQSNGQLWWIASPETLPVATAIGAPGGGVIGGMDFDGTRGVIFAASDTAGGSRLVAINPLSGAQTLVGVLGAGIADVNGLAVVPGGAIFGIDAATENLLSIDRATGVASILGSTRGVFGAQFGMALRIRTCNDIDFNNDGVSPDAQDFADMLHVFSGGPCHPDFVCDTIDFNNDGVVPDVQDFVDYLVVFAGGACP